MKLKDYGTIADILEEMLIHLGNRPDEVFGSDHWCEFRQMMIERIVLLELHGHNSLAARVEKYYNMMKAATSYLDAFTDESQAEFMDVLVLLEPHFESLKGEKWKWKTNQTKIKQKKS